MIRGGGSVALAAALLLLGACSGGGVNAPGSLAAAPADMIRGETLPADAGVVSIAFEPHAASTLDVAYDAAAHRYTLTVSALADAEMNTATDRNAGGQQGVLYKPGDADGALTLTYASFGAWRAAPRQKQPGESDDVYFGYGFETADGYFAVRTDPMQDGADDGAANGDGASGGSDERGADAPKVTMAGVAVASRP